MSTEVFKSTTDGSLAAAIHDEFFELAKAFSLASHFDIVDSYSLLSIPPRYQGDPYDKGYWTSGSDIGNNTWFVIECNSYLTTQHLALPRWQCKIQAALGSPGLLDVSDPTGVAYPLHHGQTYRNCFRFGPNGGWDFDLSTPDFDPVSGIESTENHRMYVGHAGSGDATRWYLVFGDGWFARFGRRNESAFEPMTVGGFMGDFYPVDSASQPMPRCFIGSDSQMRPDGIATGRALCESPEWSSSSGSWGLGNAGIWFEDKDNDSQEIRFSLPRDLQLVTEYSQPCKHGSVLEVDIFPYQPIPEGHGVIGDIPAFGKMYGLGYQPFNSKTWVSLGNGNQCLTVKWDGSTSLY